MTLEDRLDRVETNLARLAATQEKMGDVLGLTVESQVQLAERTAETEKKLKELSVLVERIGVHVDEFTDKLNGLIAVVDGVIRRRDQS